MNEQERKEKEAKSLLVAKRSFFEAMRKQNGVDDNDIVFDEEGKVDDEKPGTECVVCCGNQRNCVFLPCGHVCCCFECAETWKKSKGTRMTCFVCNERATSIKKVFFS